MTDLNDIMSFGNYYSYSGNKIFNMPSDEIIAFSLRVYRTSGSYVVQEFTQAGSGGQTVFTREYVELAWRPWRQVICINDLYWKQLSSVVSTEANKHIDIPYDQNVHELCVSYGRENSGQAYSGGTVVISRYEDKPAVLPLRILSFNSIFEDGSVYIHNTQADQTLSVCKIDSNCDVRFIVYYR